MGSQPLRQYLRDSSGANTSRRRWKRKSSTSQMRRRRDLAKRYDPEGSGDRDGIVLPMDMVTTGVYDVAYTIPLKVGTPPQNFSLQVDTGSSDLWIASKSCSTDPCDATRGRLYDPSASSTYNDTGESFEINYLQGRVDGPIVWDTVEIGGYSIDNQALSAATSVTSEPLASNFNGILGLALPLNSLIAQVIPPVTNNNPDGATFASNLFGITPISQAPSAHFFSLVLARPGSDRLPSLLGIGRHPSFIASNSSNIKYSTVLSDATGTQFWKTDVRAITVYVNGVTKSVALSRGIKGTPWPVAVLDSGVPRIITTSAIANGIYGAIGIGPAADGSYYVPCTTPLNMTITLDGMGEIPLHPLDLTSEPSDGPGSETCVGIIQAADAAFSNPTSNIGDIILGVPFLRNTYTVMAYQIPDSNGQFDDDSSDDASPKSGIHPRLGLLGLTDPTTALDEFRTVRVLNQPLPSTGGPGGNSASSDEKKGLSVGIDVLIALVGFFGMCIFLFALRWYLVKRRWNRAAKASSEGGDTKDAFGYRLARRGSQSSIDQPSESTLRSLRTNDSKKKSGIEAEYAMGNIRPGSGDSGVDEFGSRRSKRDDLHDMNDPWDPRNYSMAFRDSLYDAEQVSSPQSLEPPPETISRPDHQRTTSELRNNAQSILIPLLAHTRGSSRSNDLTELHMGNLPGMAGVGTAARGSMIDPSLRHSSVGSVGSNGTSPSRTSRRTSLPPQGPRPASGRSKSDSLSSVGDVGHGS